MGNIINYSNRDFQSIKQALIEYAKQYYPESFQDFTDGSVGSMILDAAAYIGDGLSFFLDYQANETFLESAQQFENILKLAREKGYRDTGKPSATGPVDLYISVPASSTGGPNLNYLPILKKDTTFIVQQTGASYLLLEDVDFGDAENTEVIVLTVDSDGIPSNFAIKAKGNIISGALFKQTETIETFENFLKVRIQNPLLSEIISVYDSSGNEYFQVDFLSQNVVYKFLKNNGSDSTNSPYKMIKFYAPRRFVIENIDGYYYLIFGNGSVDSVVDPRNILLDYNSRSYTTEKKIDPKNIIQSDKLGIAPSNTTLTITYRANNSKKMGVSQGSLNRATNPIFEFPSGATSQSIINTVIGSFEVENSKPITNINQTLNAQELKRRAYDAYSSQYRAVTKEDYIYACYSLDPKLGSIKRANIMQDTNSFKRNLNLFVISEDSDGYLATCSQTLKENLKLWLHSQKMINDTVDILDAKIINLGIEFVVDTNESNKDRVHSLCLTKLIEKLSNKQDIGQSFSIANIYKTLNTIPEVIDAKKVKITLQNGTGYSSSNFDIYGNLSYDGSYIICNKDSIFEIKYPTIDIKGTVI